jgi:hypothetical protein
MLELAGSSKVRFGCKSHALAARSPFLQLLVRFLTGLSPSRNIFLNAGEESEQASQRKEVTEGNLGFPLYVYRPRLLLAAARGIIAALRGVDAG